MNYYDGQRVMAEYNASDALQKYYVDGNQYIDEHVVMHDAVANADRYYLTQSAYTVAGLVGPTGSALEMYTYDSYGRAKMFSGSGNPLSRAFSLLGNPNFFTGQRLDPINCGRLPLYHYRARGYDPANGRFMQRDPHGLDDTVMWGDSGMGNPMLVMAGCHN